jgi:hypothetical protein
MRRLLGVPVAFLLAVAAGCDSSSPTRATESPTASAAASATVTDASAFWAKVQMDPPVAPADLSGTAVVNGFRVHPDPDEDGVIHVFSDESVAVNATDIATRPPAEQSYLVMNWGDGPNRRVGCGPCRADHQYDPGRYRLTATAEGIPAEAGGETNRSITLEVQVFARREKPEEPQKPAFVSHFQSFGFMPTVVTVGSDFLLVLPLDYPPGVTPRFPFVTLTCTPLLAAIPRLVAPVPFPGGLGGTLRARRAGTCTAKVYGTDANGPFTETSTVTIQ